MDQFVPDVSENDITRVVGRDFSAGVHDVIYEMIRRLEVRARDEKERIIEFGAPDLAYARPLKGNVLPVGGNDGVSQPTAD